MRKLSLMTTIPLLLGCKPDTNTDAPAPSDHHGHGHHHGHEADPGEVGEHGYRGHHRFDDPAAWAAEFDSPERAAWQKPDAVLDSLALDPSSSVADLGAGTGYFALRFAERVPGGKVYAVDIEPSMVAWLGERARERGLANVVAVQGEAHDPALPDAVDLVFMCNVFHHLADPQRYFAAVATKLRAGGRVVIVDFKPDNPDDAPGPPKAMRMTIAQIRAPMEAAGYRLASSDSELLPWQYVLVFER